MTAAPVSIKNTPSGLKGELALFKRRRIREEAAHLIFQQGYESATIDAIAERLKVTKPFIYSYYKNKGEILYDISRLGITLSLQVLDQCLEAPGTHWDRLKLVVDQVTRLPQEPFAEVNATPAAALDQVREVMLIWVRNQDDDQDDSANEQDDADVDKDDSADDQDDGGGDE